MFQGLIDVNTIKKLYDKYPSALRIKQQIQKIWNRKFKKFK